MEINHMWFDFSIFEIFIDAKTGFTFDFFEVSSEHFYGSLFGLGYNYKRIYWDFLYLRQIWYRLP